MTNGRDTAPIPVRNGVPPQNLEAEENVLGAMLIAPNAIDRAVEAGLEPLHFYRDSHGRIYRAALALHSQGQPVDAITMTARLEATGELDKVGGRVRLHELGRLVPATANTGHWARIIVEKAIMRGLILAGGEISQLGWDGEGEVPELIAEAERLMTEVAEAGDANDAAPLSADLAEIGLDVKAARESGQANMGRLTGFTELDGILRGFWDGQFIIIAARPGIGKSALALNIAENFAERKEGVLLVSLEMSRRELQMRALARECRIDSAHIEEGLLDDTQFEKLRQGFKAVNDRGAYLQVKDSGAASVAQIKAEARRMKRAEAGLSMIVVDYVQLMVAGLLDNRTAELAQITRALKQLAMELKVPVVGLSQLNRNLEHRQEKRPTLADLRESGSLEQDADVVIFLYRDSAYNPDADPANASEVELIVAKNRKGRSGTAKVDFIERYVTFTNRSPLPKGANTE